MTWGSIKRRFKEKGSYFKKLFEQTEMEAKRKKLIV